MYMDETFETAVSVWAMFNRYGLPNGGGPMQERPLVIQAINVVEEERALWEAREMERRKRKANGTR